MTQNNSRAEYFDEMYRANPDPWNFATSAYEAEKYAATLAALPRDHFRSGLEVGCSIGILTQLLATRCDCVLGVDVSAVAITRAIQLAQHATHICFARLEIPVAWPAERFDLVIVSEVLYFLTPEQIVTTAGRIVDSLDADGVVGVVNWLGENDMKMTGDQAADMFIDQLQPALHRSERRRTMQYRIDILEG
jgi:2-polyprenyl-3-methyl-5-hydroxy-6-metoxy-1,4-benzoquinol methylase